MHQKRIGFMRLLLCGGMLAQYAGSLASAATAGPSAMTLACPAGKGTAGVAYSSSLTATGGVTPYKFSISTGALPAGLALDAATGKITGTPSAGGSATFTAKVLDSLVVGAGGSPDSATASCTIAIVVPKLSIRAVSFFDNITIFKDKSGSIAEIKNPMWTSAGTNERVGYAGGSKMNVTLKLHVDTPPAAPVPNVTIQGQVEDVGNLASKNPITIPASVSDVDAPEIIADTAFPKETHYFAGDSLTINWTYKIAGGAPVALGSTSHTVYVTLQKPLAGTKVYLTTIHLAVSHDGASDEQFAFEQTWNTFFSGPADTKSWDDRTLYYYKPGTGFGGCPFGSVEPLLTGGNGQCTTWALLLIKTLAVNGINSRMYQITTKDGDFFLVKDWTYGAAGAPPVPGDPHRWLMKFKSSIPEMVPSPTAPNAVYGRMTSKDTLAGQNSKPPAEKVFGSHFIVKYAPAGSDCSKTDCYFDPSYGATYSDEKGFQSSAVDGYLKRFPTDNAATGRVAKPTATVNIKFAAL